MRTKYNMKKKYPILEKAKKERKIIGAKGYTDYMKGLKNQEVELAKAKLEMRTVIFNRIKAVYRHDLALLEEAENEYNTLVGKK